MADTFRIPITLTLEVTDELALRESAFHLMRGPEGTDSEGFMAEQLSEELGASLQRVVSGFMAGFAAPGVRREGVEVGPPAPRD